MDYTKYKDKRFVLQQISNLIKDNPKLVVEAIESSNINIENPNDKVELVNKTAYALSHSKSFPRKIGEALALMEQQKEFSNLGGKGKVDVKGEALRGGKQIVKGAASGAKTGGLFGIIAGAVVGAVDAGFGFATAGKRAKIEEEQYRQQLLGSLFEGKKKKSNLVPILIVGGVLIVGAIVTYIALKD